jgi:microcystin-dependent protein
MAIQNRSYFFTPTVNNERFLSQDEPTEQVMRNFADSVAFKKEASDTATETQQGLVESATQVEFDAGTDNNANGFALFVRPSFIKAKLLAFFSSIQSQITDINNTIGDIQNDVTNIQGDITNITNQFGDEMPIGAIILYPKITPPNAKWQLCEGQTLDNTLFPELFNLIGYDFGGAGTSFSLPDMRSKFIAGFDATAAPEYQTIGQGGGSDSVTLTGAQSGVAAHTHTVTEPAAGSHSHTFTLNVRNISPGGSNVPGLVNNDSTNQGVQGGFPGYEGTSMSNAGSHTHGTSVNPTANTDATQAHENRPAFIAFPYMIKVKN